MMMKSMKMKLMGADGECSHRHATASVGGECDDGDGDDDEGGEQSHRHVTAGGGERQQWFGGDRWWTVGGAKAILERKKLLDFKVQNPYEGGIRYRIRMNVDNLIPC